MEILRRNRGKILYGIVAAALFLLLPGTLGERRELSVAELVTFGDSVFGEVRDETAVPAQVAGLLDMSCYNAAMGGTQAARSDLEHRLDYSKDSLSLVGLMKSLQAGDFGMQQTVHIRESNTEYFEEVIDGLDRVDFSKTEVVLLQHGLNDFYAGIPIEDGENPYDEYTFKGALRTSLSILQTVCPNARIVLVTPTYTWHRQSGLSCEEYDAGYGNQEVYVQAEQAVAEEFGVEVIDLYHDFFPHERWEDWEMYTRDGLHPNEEGRRLMAERIAAFLQK